MRAHPGYDYAGALLTAEARLNIAGPDGDRQASAEEFFSGVCSSVLMRRKSSPASKSTESAANTLGNTPNKKSRHRTLRC